MLQAMYANATRNAQKCYRRRRRCCHRWTAVLQVMFADAISDVHGATAGNDGTAIGETKLGH
jgi:hypothetical protein